MKALHLGLDQAAVGQARRACLGRQAGGERLVALQALGVQALELCDGLFMVVHPQVQRAVVLGGVDPQGRALLAPLVAPSSFARFQGQQKALGKIKMGVALVKLRRGGNHLRTGEHVARH